MLKITGILVPIPKSAMDSSPVHNIRAPVAKNNTHAAVSSHRQNNAVNVSTDRLTTLLDVSDTGFMICHQFHSPVLAISNIIQQRIYTNVGPISFH